MRNGELGGRVRLSRIRRPSQALQVFQEGMTVVLLRTLAFKLFLDLELLWCIRLLEPTTIAESLFLFEVLHDPLDCRVG